MFKVGDIVTRKKYGNDIIFKIDKIEGKTIYLKGVDIRLYADSTSEDLILSTISKKKENVEILRKLDTDNFFFIPGTILHIDSDSDYMEKCLNYYKNNSIKADGYIYKEKDISQNIRSLLLKHRPSILVITGHDAYYKEKKNDSKYKNSLYFIESVKEARKTFFTNDKLIIVSGACQSDFEGLIKSGSTYASSPKKINIHALDPAIVASSIALTDSTKTVDINEILNKTHYGSNGIGGIITNGKMYVGYPRKGE